MYGAAQANEAAARTLTNATMLIDVARTKVTDGQPLQAVEDAQRALGLLGEVAASTDVRVSRAAVAGAKSGAASLNAALQAMFRVQTSVTLAHLAGASADAAAAAAAATDEAIMHRQSAEQLMDEWM